MSIAEMLDGIRALRRQYYLTLLTGLFECIGFAGVVFGWASLVFVLKKDGYFSEMCVVNGTNNATVTDCSAQDDRFSLIFTVASFSNNFLCLLTGLIFDRFGTRVTRFLAIALYTLGTLLVALSGKALSFLFFIALPFIAVGGILFLITNIQVGNLFGSHRSTIITLYNGAFDSSSGVFLFIKILYENGISLRTSFLFLSACDVIHLLRTFFLMPKTHIPYPVPEDYKYGVSCGKSNSYSVERYEAQRELNNISDRTEQNAVGEPLNDNSPQQGEQTDSSFKSCVLSWFFLWHLIWISVMQLRHYLFIASLNSMLNRLTQHDQDAVSQMTNAFAYTQLSSIGFAPWNGYMMDKLKKRILKSGQATGVTEKEADLCSAAVSLFVTPLLCLVFCVFATIPDLNLQYGTFIVQVINRSFLYGGNAAFINIAFPAKHFGKLYGLIMTLSAVVSLLQYPLLILIQSLGGDPFYVNIGLIILLFLAFIHPVYVFLHCRRLASQRGNAQSISLDMDRKASQ